MLYVVVVGVVRWATVVLSAVLLSHLLIAFSKMPTRKSADHTVRPITTFKRLINNKKYREGVIAQVFYVAAQIMCWTFIIQYAENLGFSKATELNV